MIDGQDQQGPAVRLSPSRRDQQHGHGVAAARKRQGDRRGCIPRKPRVQPFADARLQARESGEVGRQSHPAAVRICPARVFSVAEAVSA